MKPRIMKTLNHLQVSKKATKASQTRIKSQYQEVDQTNNQGREELMVQMKMMSIICPISLKAEEEEEEGLQKLDLIMIYLPIGLKYLLRSILSVNFRVKVMKSKR